MSHATRKLLQTAAEIIGGEEALADHLNITKFLLRSYLEERRPLPDFLLLRAVDVVLEQVNNHPLRTTSKLLKAQQVLKSGTSNST